MRHDSVRLPTSRRPQGSTALWLLGALVFALALGALIAAQLHWGQALEPAHFDYAQAERGACAQLESDTADQLPRVRVRAPANYDAQIPHALLIVLSPAGFGPGLTERFTGLTHTATARGLVVAYVAARPLRTDLPQQLANLPARIARHWCIDATRITYAGHSDGGTLAQVIALHAASPTPRAVFSSAGGLRESDFDTLQCPPRAEVLLMHGRADSHFPDYGASAARGWARCLGCSGVAAQSDAAGCTSWRDCRGSLRLCDHAGGHLRWPETARQAVAELAAPSR